MGGLFPTGDSDRFSFTGEAGAVVDVSLVTGDFDPVIDLLLAGEVIAVNDDGGDGRNSLLDDFILPASGDYEILVRSFNSAGEGAYELQITSVASPFTLQQQFSGSTDGDLAAGEHHLYPLEIAAFSLVNVDLVSEAFDPFLVVYTGSELAARNADNRLAANDDGGEGLNSRLEENLPAGSYLLEVRSFSSSGMGVYTLTVETAALADDEDAQGAIQVAYGEQFEGTLFPPADSDLLAFSGSAGDAVVIALTSADFDPFLELEIEGEVVAVNDDGGEGLSSLLDFVLPVSAEYLVRVRSFNNTGSGSYAIMLDDVTPPIAMQAAVDTSGTREAAIANAGEIHLHPLTVAGLSQVQIDLASTEFDAFLTLFAGTGAGDRNEANFLASDDDGGVGLNSRIELVLPAGDYLIEARPLSSGLTGAYSLQVQLTPIEGDEDDPSPVLLAYGDEVSGTLSPAGDEDVHEFTGQAGDEIEIDVASDDIDPFVELSFNGEVLASDDDGGDDLDALIDNFVLPQSASYRVTVRSLEGESGTYRVALRNLTPPLTLHDIIGSGSQAGSLDQGGQIQLFPFSLDERSRVQIDLVSSDFDAFLSLFAGGGPEDRQQGSLLAEDDNSGGGNNARLSVDLRPGSYLIEARDAVSDSAGDFGLELKIEALPELRSTMALTSGIVNGSVVNLLNPVATVAAGAKISGELLLSLDNQEPASEVFPVGASPTWGEAETSFWEIEEWAPAGQSDLQAIVDLTAPEIPGSYHIIVAGASERSAAYIMSGTHWQPEVEERWGNGDEVAVWSEARIEQAVSDGWVGVEWFSDYEAEVAATAIEVRVVAAQAVAVGPVLFDVDTDPGNQGLRRIETSGPGQIIAVQLFGQELAEINGWSIRVDFDPDQLAYVQGSFQPGDFIPGLIPLEDLKESQFQVGGTVLGTDAANAGDGYLGVFGVEVLDGFAFSTDLVISQVTLRTVDAGRVKEAVRSRATVNAPFGQSGGPISLDMDDGEGNQNSSRIEGAGPGRQYQVELFVEAAPDISGWSVRIEFDSDQVHYVSGSFQASSFITGLIPLVAEKENRVEVGGTVLGTSATSSGDGLLARLTFELAAGFADSAEIAITQVSLNTVESGEEIQSVRRVAVLAATSRLAGDFSGDKRVNFSDFFLFADHFGRDRTDPDWDEAYDLNASGEVDFSDFFLFADVFGTEEQSKLLALAREFIGLPHEMTLEQNFPNPFNHSTTIGFLLPTSALVDLAIYDITGSRIAVLHRGRLSRGFHRFAWNGRDDRGGMVSTGAYFYRLTSGGLAGEGLAREGKTSRESQVGKMLFLK